MKNNIKVIAAHALLTVYFCAWFVASGCATAYVLFYR